MHRTVAALSYVEPASTLIGGFKYHAALQHGRVLGDVLIEGLRQTYSNEPLPGILLPVPLHTSRLRERGFNQALVLARQVGTALDIPVAFDWLQRVRQTPPQQGLSAKERKRNLRGAFGMKPGISLDSYASIALIDDVVTTMTTVHELARLVRAGRKTAPALHIWCLARA